MKKLILYFVLIGVLGFQISASALAQTSASTILDTLEAAAESDNPEFVSLLMVLELAELTNTLDNPFDEFTLFAPTDLAFTDFILDEENFETWLTDPSLIEPTMLYHIADGAFLADDLAALDSVPTLQGGEIEISTSGDGTLLLNGISVVIEADVQVGNSVIHMINTVLEPPADTGEADEPAEAENTTEAETIEEPADTEESKTPQNLSGGDCIVSTDKASTIQVRVGPGLNRTVVSFLPVDTDFVVQGKSEDDDRAVWYKLDKDKAAPGRAINEAWVAAAGLDSSGDCDTIADEDAPPIIPIAPPPPSTTDNSGGDSGSGDSGGSSGGTAPAGTPANGTYTFFLSDTTNASCEGTGNISFPTRDTGVNMSFSARLVSSGNTITINGDRHTLDGSVYTGRFSIGGDTFVSTIYPNTTSQFNGQFIFAFSIDGTNCSATINYSAQR